MLNTVKKKLNGVEYGLFLGTMVKANYGRETGKSLSTFFNDIKTPEGDYYFGVFIKECINAYNHYNNIGERMSLEDVYKLIDETKIDDWMSVLKDLFQVPEVANAEAGEK